MRKTPAQRTFTPSNRKSGACWGPRFMTFIRSLVSEG
jgi:hypothetical protein